MTALPVNDGMDNADPVDLRSVHRSIGSRNGAASHTHTHRATPPSAKRIWILITGSRCCRLLPRPIRRTTRVHGQTIMTVDGVGRIQIQCSVLANAWNGKDEKQCKKNHSKGCLRELSSGWSTTVWRLPIDDTVKQNVMLRYTNESRRRLEIVDCPRMLLYRCLSPSPLLPSSPLPFSLNRTLSSVKRIVVVPKQTVIVVMLISPVGQALFEIG